MSSTPFPHIERHCDVAVVGGSAAGLAAALQLGRQRRSVIVVDAGEPRNAVAAHVHGYLGREGCPPSELAAIGRAEVRANGGEVLHGLVRSVHRTEGGQYRLDLSGGHSVIARRVIAATGLVDELPDIEGIEQHWGRDVVHCPFCHGFEVRDRRIVQGVTHAMALHTVPLWRQLTAHLTVVLADDVDVDLAHIERLQAAGVAVVSGRVGRVVSSPGGSLEAVELTSGARLEADAVVVLPRFRARTEPFASLGLPTVAHASGLGEVVETDGTGATAIPGLYAAGNVTEPSLQVLPAAADGSRVGAMVSVALADEDVRSARRPMGNEADWDHRYGGDQIWSGNPNGSLVNEVGGLPSGRALDVGAGEGGDALWLAEQGWRVTANDVSRRGLDRIAAEAERRGLRVELLHADANALGAFAVGGFDLVSAQYASIPRTTDDRAVHNLIDAVAPGGTLIVVSHDLEPMRVANDPHVQTRAFDPDAYVRVEDFVVVIAESSAWSIEVFEKRPRPGGAASAAHHVDDVVLRARRRSG